ncbi:hypothetical protein HETIRDRAFT_104193 [Heterobasidion irregulare TC 32-1]|uniref:Uncharacterized protein n=1 Tax=Heterobasidion irregulare (strain TC 32-1) TaxID=747525 RepID=W4K198_HETIT|nr:uncharacterized protein HETIRDRAFT_104193 [Heterobasidion irregulare TC 32-1]ETW78851.1 hypothetical protein HETIRDRAFT_104193 [Heterobasidion irregulare TC 32-1]
MSTSPGDPGIYGARPGGVSPVPVSSPPRPSARPACAQNVSSPPANTFLFPAHLIPSRTPPTPSPHKILAYPTAVQRRLSPLSPEAHSLFHRSPSDTVARRSLRCWSRLASQYPSASKLSYLRILQSIFLPQAAVRSAPVSHPPCSPVLDLSCQGPLCVRSEFRTELATPASRHLHNGTDPDPGHLAPTFLLPAALHHLPPLERFCESLRVMTNTCSTPQRKQTREYADCNCSRIDIAGPRQAAASAFVPPASRFSGVRPAVLRCPESIIRFQAASSSSWSGARAAFGNDSGVQLLFEAALRRAFPRASKSKYHTGSAGSGFGASQRLHAARREPEGAKASRKPDVVAVSSPTNPLFPRTPPTRRPAVPRI